MKRVIDKDRGWRRIRLHITQLGYIHVDAGVFPDSPAHNTAGEDIPMEKVATWQEYGTAKAPARPFMRTTAKRQLQNLRNAKTMVVQGVISGKMLPREAMVRIGLYYVRAIRHTIKNSLGWAVPNAPSTIADKGSMTPLVDTNQLHDAIAFKTRGKK